ncbi:MAG TPA: FAD:protein FMN transferase [Kofleriaceae bacterium]|jgi:thiamine biosynthesis lipoprotein|nr:FAD:protein FMN transferase [Kofleriaceae bacterium]
MIPRRLATLVLVLVLGLGAALAGPAAGRAGADPAPVAPPKPPDASHPASKVQYSDVSMGTDVRIWLWTADERAAAQAAEAVFNEMKRLDLEMSNWKPASDVSQINVNAGVKPVRVSDETYTVIARAVDVSKRSGGVFDITIEAFRGVWKFDEDMDGSLPDPAEVKKRLALVNWKDLVLDAKQHTVFLRRKGMAITLGGIAKGYAVDRCVAILRARGFTDFMMQAGGDMYVAGKKGSEPWVVGIRDPRGPTNTLFAVAPIEDHSFSTSGDYERGFVKDGVRYHHIIDTRTGQPAHASRSVTVRATDAFTADAWSKVMFILGPHDALELIKREKLTDFEVVWVDDKNQVVTTDGLKGVIHMLKEPTPGP